MNEFYVKFWGTRGSIPCSGKDYVIYGGNTPCVEVCIGNQTIILDAGSGIRSCGLSCQSKAQTNYHILLTHTHLDHIMGLPFFSPLLKSDKEVHIWAGHLRDKAHIKKAISQMITPPLFPIPLEAFKAQVSYHHFRSGDRINLFSDIEIETCNLNHPDSACGYKITYKGKSLCYITDHEHGNKEIDKQLEQFILDTDLLIYDGMYCETKYVHKKGWGHSTWQKAAELSTRLNIKRLAVFHHDPSMHDNDLTLRENELQKIITTGFLAQDEQVIFL